MTDALTRTISDLLGTAASQASSPAPRQQIERLQNRLAGPLRVAIAGKVKAGKSTLLNALLGEELAPTDAGECTRIVTWYQYGHQPKVTLHPHAGPPTATFYERTHGALEVDLNGRDPGDLERIEVAWPSSRLDHLTFIDTPGLDSVTPDLSKRTRSLLTPAEDRGPEVDAVLYLLRHTHASDIRFLEAFRDDQVTRTTPMNAVGVLSRADEIGSCQIDALDIADRVARRYQAEPRMRRLCPIIVPVDGLLGHAAATLRESEYRALARLAAAPQTDTYKLLVTATRFARHPSTLQVPETERADLLDRFGLFGVRLAIQLIRQGEAGSAARLSEVLARRSGLQQLRTVLLNQFTERSRILKAHSALKGLEAILRGGGCQKPDAVLSGIERIFDSTHAFQEMRILDSIHTDGLRLPADRLEELERLLGGSGHHATVRLGLTPDTDDEQVQAAALEALDRWRKLAEHPITTRPVQLAARGAARTLEGILTVADHDRSTVEIADT